MVPFLLSVTSKEPVASTARPLIEVKAATDGYPSTYPAATLPARVTGGPGIAKLKRPMTDVFTELPYAK
jgi:hypothetical protein